MAPTNISKAEGEPEAGTHQPWSLETELEWGLSQ